MNDLRMGTIFKKRVAEGNICMITGLVCTPKGKSAAAFSCRRCTIPLIYPEDAKAIIRSAKDLKGRDLRD